MPDEMSFANKKDRNSFMGWFRLLTDDLNEFSFSFGPLVALNRRADDEELMGRLNQHAQFWNSVLLCLQTTSIIVLGRIHETDQKAYLKKLVSTLNSYNKPAEKALLKGFRAVESSHKTLLSKVRLMRNNVFAHTSLIRPLHVEFGFNNLTWDQFEAYWKDIAEQTENLGLHLFGGPYHPQFTRTVLDEERNRANAFFDSWRDKQIAKRGTGRRGQATLTP